MQCWKPVSFISHLWAQIFSISFPGTPLGLDFLGSQWGSPHPHPALGGRRGNQAPGAAGVRQRGRYWGRDLREFLGPAASREPEGGKIQAEAKGKRSILTCKKWKSDE